MELGQALGLTRTQAVQLIWYVWDRPVGKVHQEIGGTLVCLAGLCGMLEIDMQNMGELELRRCWDNADKIREKNAGKPKWENPL